MESRPEFEEPWEDTFVKGGKAVRFSQANRGPDTFVGYGEDRTDPLQGSWFNMMCLACSILSSRNTARIVERSAILPSGAYLNQREIPSELKYFEEPHKHGARPYRIHPTQGSESKELLSCNWDECSLKSPFGIRVKKVPGVADKWMAFDRDGEATRPEATWWELVSMSLLILSSTNTSTVTDAMGDIDETKFTFPRRKIFNLLDDIQSAPYIFEQGTGADVNVRGLYDF